MRAVIKLFKSFIYAFKGLWFSIKNCRNFRIHTVAAALVLYFSRFYNFSKTENCILYLIIALVMVSECVNTAIEQLCNAVTRDYSPVIKIAKDVAAGSVLIVASVSVLIAVKLFFDTAVIKQILIYFSSPIRLIFLLICAAASIIYIFYEDIFKNAKK